MSGHPIKVSRHPVPPGFDEPNPFNRHQDIDSGRGPTHLVEDPFFAEIRLREVCQRGPELLEGLTVNTARAFFGDRSIQRSKSLV